MSEKRSCRRIFIALNRRTYLVATFDFLGGQLDFVRTDLLPSHLFNMRWGIGVVYLFRYRMAYLKVDLALVCEV